METFTNMHIAEKPSICAAGLSFSIQLGLL
jgi:hypothetical protein